MVLIHILLRNSILFLLYMADYFGDRTVALYLLSRIRGHCILHKSNLMRIDPGHNWIEGILLIESFGFVCGIIVHLISIRRIKMFAWLHHVSIIVPLLIHLVCHITLSSHKLWSLLILSIVVLHVESLIIHLLMQKKLILLIDVILINLIYSWHIFHLLEVLIP